jgi:hypothetical protein
MRYRINPAGNRIVDATPEETRTLRPCIVAAFRRWRAPEGDIEDFAQNVEIVAWQAIQEQRVPGDGFKRPEDALLDFMFAIAWNQWRNHSRLRSTRCEVLHDELPDMASSSPDAMIEARDALRRISMRPDVARILLATLDGPYPERRENLAHGTFWSRRKQARTWAKDVVLGHWREPSMPEPSTPWKRKKKR